jgi:hypothetical protein
MRQLILESRYSLFTVHCREIRQRRLHDIIKRKWYLLLRIRVQR